MLKQLAAHKDLHDAQATIGQVTRERDQFAQELAGARAEIQRLSKELEAMRGLEQESTELLERARRERDEMTADYARIRETVCEAVRKLKTPGLVSATAAEFLLSAELLR